MSNVWLWLLSFFMIGASQVETLRDRRWASPSLEDSAPSTGPSSNLNHVGRGAVLKHDHHDHGSGPYFEDEINATLTTVHVGDSVHLNCRVGMLHDKMVTWLRNNEDTLELLTVGQATYVGDTRYSLHFKYPNNWRLRIKEVRLTDSGTYVCQVSTHPPKGLHRKLEVLAPEMHIVDERGYEVVDRYLRAGSTIELTCIVRHVDTAEHHVTWRKDGELVRVKSDVLKQAFVSQITIPNAQKSDSGVYSCSVSKYSQVSATIHVLEGETQAAIQTEQAGGCRSTSQHVHLQCFLLLLLFLQRPLLR